MSELWVSLPPGRLLGLRPPTGSLVRPLGGAESPVYPVQEDRVPYVTIVLREGRSVEQKREMVKAVTEAISRTTGAKPEMVHIIVHDLPGHNLARDGILLSDRA